MPTPKQCCAANVDPCTRKLFFLSNANIGVGRPLLDIKKHPVFSFIFKQRIFSSQTHSTVCVMDSTLVMFANCIEHFSNRFLAELLRLCGPDHVAIRMLQRHMQMNTTRSTAYHQLVMQTPAPVLRHVRQSNDCHSRPEVAALTWDLHSPSSDCAHSRAGAHGNRSCRRTRIPFRYRAPFPEQSLSVVHA